MSIRTLRNYSKKRLIRNLYRHINHRITRLSSKEMNNLRSLRFILFRKISLILFVSTSMNSPRKDLSGSPSHPPDILYSMYQNLIEDYDCVLTIDILIR
jgi:hypothetical protein